MVGRVRWVQLGLGEIGSGEFGFRVGWDWVKCVCLGQGWGVWLGLGGVRWFWLGLGREGLTILWCSM